MDITVEILLWGMGGSTGPKEIKFNSLLETLWITI